MAWKSIILDEPNAHNNILLLVCPRLICYIPVFLCKAYSFHVSMMIIAFILKIWLQRVDIKIVMGYVDLIHTFHFGTKWNITLAIKLHEERKEVSCFLLDDIFLEGANKELSVFSGCSCTHSHTTNNQSQGGIQGSRECQIKSGLPKRKVLINGSKWV